MRPGGARSAQLPALVLRQGSAKSSRFNALLPGQDKRPVTPANCAGRVSQSTMLACFEVMAGHVCSLRARMQGQLLPGL